MHIIIYGCRLLRYNYKTYIPKYYMYLHSKVFNLCIGRNYNLKMPDLSPNFEPWWGLHNYVIHGQPSTNRLYHARTLFYLITWKSAPCSSSSWTMGMLAVSTARCSAVWPVDDRWSISAPADSRKRTVFRSPDAYNKRLLALIQFQCINVYVDSSLLKNSIWKNLITLSLEIEAKTTTSSAGASWTTIPNHATFQIIWLTHTYTHKLTISLVSSTYWSEVN